MGLPRPVLRVALTGGIATGKSHCLKQFAAAGIPVIDADGLAREAVGVGTPGLAAVTARFGPGVVGPDGALDRRRLGRVVFDDAAARRDLEAIIHPFVFSAIEAWFGGLDREADKAGRPAVAVADVPLLFETGHEEDFDVVVVTSCEPEMAVLRLMARDGLSESDARRRLASQIPIAKKRAAADYVIDTSGSVADTDRQVDEVLVKLQHRGRDRVS